MWCLACLNAVSKRRVCGPALRFCISDGLDTVSAATGPCEQESQVPPAMGSTSSADCVCVSVRVCVVPPRVLQGYQGHKMPIGIPCVEWTFECSRAQITCVCVLGCLLQRHPGREPSDSAQSVFCLGLTFNPRLEIQPENVRLRVAAKSGTDCVSGALFGESSVSLFLCP